MLKYLKHSKNYIYDDGGLSMSIKITSDSTCDLPQALLEKYQITVIPLYINLDGQVRRDGVDIVPGQIFDHVAAGGNLPTTAAINIADYTEIFSALSAQHEAVIHINISQDFSSCHQNAVIAAGKFDNVFVVDSRNLSCGHGFVVLEAALAAARGEKAGDIVSYLESLTHRVDTTFVVDKLDYLAKGGRCSAVVALGANLLKLKPCIQVADGKMGVAKKYRGNWDKVLLDYVKERVADRTDINHDRVFLVHTRCDQAVVESVRAALVGYGFQDIYEATAGCTISSHCGPGTIGVLFVHKA